MAARESDLHGSGAPSRLPDDEGASDRLRTVERQCRSLLEGTPDGVFVQVVGRFVYVNPVVVRLLGAQRAEDLLGTSVYDRSPAAFHAAVRSRDHGKNGDDPAAALVEEALICLDGTVVPVEVAAAPFEHDDAEAGLVFVHDLRPRKRVEAAAHRMTQVYAALSQCNEAIVRCRNQADLFASVCRAAVEAGGMKLAWIGLVSDDDDVMVAASFGDQHGYLEGIRVSAGGSKPTGRGPCGTAIREQRPVWCQDFQGDADSAPWRKKALLSGLAAVACVPLYLEGSVVGAFNLYFGETEALTAEIRGLLVEMAADLSFALDNFQREARRLKAEDQLRKLSLAVEQSPESIVITDLNGHIEYVNEAYVRGSGYSREEALGQNPLLMEAGDTPHGTFNEMLRSVTDGQAWKGELHNRRKDGSPYVEMAFVSPLRQADGQISHYIAVREDITEKRRLALELERHQQHLEGLVAERTREVAAARHQAEEANRAKGAFVANMSHEIRTPLNAIIGLTHLLRRSGATPQQVDRLNKIDNAGRHLLSIINDILDLAKIEAGRMTLSESNLHVRALLEDVASMVAEPARAQGLIIELTCTAPVDLRGDETRLRQALLNFASNAVKFTTSGTVSIRAKLAQYQGEKVLVRFEVADTGPGIAPELLDKLFHAFSQVGKPKSNVPLGTGLGLAITAQLAKLMGGEVGVDSTPGVGSTFWFTALLQRAQGSVSSRPPPKLDDAEAAIRTHHAGATVLLAEDNPINREVSLELLHAVGLRVDLAVDGEEALESARANDYALILMDVQMPRMDGFQATRAIRLLPNHQSTPILALTANAFEQDRRDCEEAGMSAFVAKPVDPPLLYEALRTWLPRGSATQRADGTETAAQDVSTTPPSDTVPRASAKLARDGSTAATMERLATVPGLNVTRGLAVTRGKADRYVDLLTQLVELHIDDTRQLLEYAHGGDYQAAERIAHGIKGSAGNLGADHLAEVAARIEAKLRNHPHNPLGPESIRPEADAIDFDIAVLAAALPPDASPVSGQTDSPPRAQELLTVLEQLDNLLAQNDAAALELFREYAPLVRGAWGRRMPELTRAISLFDFETARVIVQELRAAAK